MKLIELLVQELPKRGGWPEDFTFAVQDLNGDVKFGLVSNVMFYNSSKWVCKRGYDAENIWGDNKTPPEMRNTILTDDYTSSIVTREQYEAEISKPAVKHSAPSFLEKGVQHMKDRAAQRDSEDGERSMKACVEAFNAMFGHNLTETQGWQFMVLLKMARTRNKFNPDDYEDGAAYTGLAGEAHSHEQK